MVVTTMLVKLPSVVENEPPFKRSPNMASIKPADTVTPSLVKEYIAFPQSLWLMVTVMGSAGAATDSVSLTALMVSRSSAGGISSTLSVSLMLSTWPRAVLPVM